MGIGSWVESVGKVRGIGWVGKVGKVELVK